MRETLNYNIHDILNFQLVREKKKDFVKDLNLPFTYFEIQKEMDSPDITMNIGEFKPSNEDSYVVDHKYYIKKNYFFCKDSDNNAKWKVEIIGFEKGKTTINYDGKTKGILTKITPDFLPQNLLLRPIIEYKLAQKGYLLIHSAGASKDGKTYLFAGRGGSFKTSLTMDLIRNYNYNFLGDDRTLLHKNKVLCFPMHLQTFNYRITKLQDEDLQNIFDRIRLIKYLRNKNLDYELDLPVNSMLTSLYILEKTNNNNSVAKSMIPLDTAVDRLVANNKMEMIKSPMMAGMDFGRYFTYMLAYSFVFPESKIATYWNNFKKNLKMILEKIPIYEINVPQQYSSDTFEKILELIKE